MKWYIIQTDLGKENKIIKSIKNYIHTNNFTGNIILPNNKNIYFLNKYFFKNKYKKNFFGYILFKVIINEKIIKFIENISNVLGFIGKNNKISKVPKILNNEEINYILSNKNNKNGIRNTFYINQKVKIINNINYNLIGTIENINYNKNLLKINVFFFNRIIPILTNFNNVKKINF